MAIFQPTPNRTPSSTLQFPPRTDRGLRVDAMKVTDALKKRVEHSSEQRGRRSVALRQNWNRPSYGWVFMCVFLLLLISKWLAITAISRWGLGLFLTLAIGRGNGVRCKRPFCFLSCESMFFFFFNLIKSSLLIIFKMKVNYITFFDNFHVLKFVIDKR